MIIIREGDAWNGPIWETIRFFAGVAVEMDMYIFRVGTTAIICAESIFGTAAQIMNFVNEPFILKRFQSSVKSRSI